MINIYTRKAWYEYLGETGSYYFAEKWGAQNKNYAKKNADIANNIKIAQNATFTTTTVASDIFAELLDATDFNFLGDDFFN